MIYFVPDGMSEVYDVKAITGSLIQKVGTIVQLSESDAAIVELDDQSYELLRPILRAMGVGYQIVINIPDVPTPRSFLYEDDINVIRIYSDELSHELAQIMSTRTSSDVLTKDELDDRNDDVAAEEVGVSFSKHANGYRR